MAVITVYQHGLKAGIAPAKSDHVRAKRDTVQGWTEKSTRSNLEFLRSVYLPELSGLGFSFTLTVQKCPESAKVWAAMRNAYAKRLKRFGFYRLHWVTEWQRRGVPHLHGMIYFKYPETDHDYVRQECILTSAWLAICKEYGAESHAQYVTTIYDTVGWLEYLAKHAARGITHYQRAKESMPASWNKASGRVWGHKGDWPTREGIRFDMSERAFWELRRRIRGYRLADARESGWNIRAGRVRAAKGMLKCHDVALSAVRGVSEWIPERVQLQLITWVLDQGFTVMQKAEDEQIDMRTGEVREFFRKGVVDE